MTERMTPDEYYEEMRRRQSLGRAGLDAEFAKESLRAARSKPPCAATERSPRNYPERGMQHRLMQWAKRFDHWESVWHDEDSRRNAKGMLDLWVLGEPYLLVAELKCEGRQPTKEQRLWLGMLAWATAACPTAFVCLWREKHEEEALVWLRDPMKGKPPAIWEG